MSKTSAWEYAAPFVGAGLWLLLVFAIPIALWRC
jgi:hypothetical protein